VDSAVEHYWWTRLLDLKKALERNDFEVFVARDRFEARELVLQKILPQTGAKRLSRGDSLTCIETGLFEAIQNHPELEFVEPFEEHFSNEEMLEQMRKSLLVDLYITGSNAVTESGTLVNLDKVGNRVAGIAFGPKYVAILVGRNKIVPDRERAMQRVQYYAAPINAMRLDKRTPCAKTSYCEDCESPDRICNTWTITEKSSPKGRVKVILINEDLGL
jgi:L-lactate utilization protein LutB